MRGERASSAAFGVEDARFIPACAGNASISRTSCACSSVHPRMRGERVTKAGSMGT